MELDDVLERVGMKGANDYFNQCTSIQVKFDVACDNTKLIKIMAKKVNSDTFSAKIIGHLKNTTPHDFEAVCDEINVIQRMTGASVQKAEKEVALANYEKGNNGGFKGKCNNCDKVGHKEADCRNKSGNGGPSTGGAGANRTCNYCGQKGHTEDYCWKKHPEKAPKKMRAKLEKEKEEREKKEAAGSSVEIFVPSLDIALSEYPCAEAESGVSAECLLPFWNATEEHVHGSVDITDAYLYTDLEEDFVRACL